MKETIFKPNQPQPGGTPAPVGETLIKSPSIQQSIGIAGGETLFKPASSPADAGIQETLFKAPPSPPGDMEGIPAEPQPEIIEEIYQLVREIGQGAMGTVYLVHHLLWDIDLAVKTIRVDRFSKAMLEMFLSEAEIWIDLAKHPHITTAFYIRDLRDMPAIFVEYAEGGSLAQWLEQGENIPLEEKLEKAIQFCEGMSYAHSRNLIHRDIKPENVLLLKDGTVKITDFGLARSLSPTGDGNSTSQIDQMESCGTPPYMPPEQWSTASAAMEPADIYSFGIMLYEMIAGQRPFIKDEDDPRPPELVFRLKHLTEAPASILTHVPDLPAELDTLIGKCLEKDPLKRFSSFTEVGELLEKIYNSISSSPYQSIPFDLEKERVDDLNNRALSYLDLKREERAEALWEQGLSLNPKHLACNINLAQLLWKRDFKKNAERIELHIDNAGETDKKTAYYYKGLMKMLSGDHVSALNIADEALFKGGSTVDLQNLKGLALLGLKNHNFARTSKLSPGGIKREYLLNDRLKDSEAAFQAALDHSPGHPGITANLGHVLAADKRENEAQQCWDEARQGGIIPKPGALQYWALNMVASYGHNTWSRCRPYFDLEDNCVYMAEGKFANSFELGIYDLDTGKKRGVIESSDILAIIPNPKRASKYLITAASTLNFKDLREKKVSRRLGSLLKKSNMNFSGMSDRYGHASIQIEAVGFSPDYRVAIGSRRNKTMEIWDLYVQRTLATFDGEEYHASVIKFRSNNKLALLGGYDGRLRVLIFNDPLDVNSYQMAMATDSHEKMVSCLTISPDDKIAVSGSQDNALRVWDLDTLQCIQVLEEHTGPVTSVAFAGNNEILMSASSDHTIKIWKRKRREDIPIEGRKVERYFYTPFKLYKDFQAYKHEISLTMSVISPDGRYALMGSSKNGQMNRQGYSDHIFLWSFGSDKDPEMPIYYRPLDPVFARVTTVSDDISIEAQSLRLVREAEALFNEDRHHLSYKKVLEALQLPGSEQNTQLTGLLDRLMEKGARQSLEKVVQAQTCQFQWMNTLQFTPCGRKLITIDQPRTGSETKPFHLVIIPVTDKDGPRLELPHEGSISTFAVDYGNRLVSAGNGFLYYWDIENGTCLKKVRTDGRSIIEIVISPDGQFALVRSFGGVLRLYSLENLSIEWETVNIDATVTSIAFGGGGRFFAFHLTMKKISELKNLPLSRELHVRDVRTFEPLLTVPESSQLFHLSSDFRLWTIRYNPSGIDLWDLTRLETTMSLQAPVSGYSLLRLIPDRRLAVMGGKTTVGLLDCIQGKLIHRITCSHEVDRIEISPDHRFAAAIGKKGGVSFINLLTRKIQKEVPGVSQVAFSPDWRTMAAGKLDFSVQLYDLDWHIYFPGQQEEWETMQTEAETPPPAAPPISAGDLGETLLKLSPDIDARNHIIRALHEYKNRRLDSAEQILQEASPLVEKLPPEYTGELPVFYLDFQTDLIVDKRYEYNREVARTLIEKTQDVDTLSIPEIIRIEQAIHMVELSLEPNKNPEDREMAKQLAHQKVILLDAAFQAGAWIDPTDETQDLEDILKQTVYILKTAADVSTDVARKKSFQMAVSVFRKLYQAFTAAIEKSKETPSNMMEARLHSENAYKIAQLSGNSQLQQKADEVRKNVHDWYHFYGSKYLRESQLEEAVIFYEAARAIAREIEDIPLQFSNIDRLAVCFGRLGDFNQIRLIRQEIDKLNAGFQYYQHVQQVKRTIMTIFMENVRRFLDSSDDKSVANRILLGNMSRYNSNALSLARELGNEEKAALIQSMSEQVATITFQNFFDEAIGKMEADDRDTLNQANNLFNSASITARQWQLNDLDKKATDMKAAVKQKLEQVRKIEIITISITSAQKKLDFNFKQLEKLRKVPLLKTDKVPKPYELNQRDRRLYDTLEKDLNQTLQTAEAINHLPSCGNIYILLSHIKLLRGEFSNALRYTDQATRVAQQLRQPEMATRAQGIWLTEAKRLISIARANIDTAIRQIKIPDNVKFYIQQAEPHLQHVRDLSRYAAPGELKPLLQDVTDLHYVVSTVMELPIIIARNKIKEAYDHLNRIQVIRDKMNFRRYPLLTAEIDRLSVVVKKIYDSRGFLGKMLSK